jgi:hypothetical protein
VATCPVCGSWFDDHGYQLVIYGLGTFDSIECAEKALRIQARERRDNLSAPLDATTARAGSRQGSVRKDGSA